MKNYLKLRAFLAFLILSILIISFTRPISYCVAQDYAHPEDSDSPEVIESLKDARIIWEVINASGIFASEDLQPHDLIRYDVEDVDDVYNVYKVKEFKKSWGENDFEQVGGIKNASYYLINREWGAKSAEFFLDQHSTYWGSKEHIDNQFDTIYETEWWDWKLINTATITYIMNDTNYDKIKYTRAEGILLERKTVVNINDGKIVGNLYIRLYSYSRFFEFSPWYYVIIGALIFAAVAAIIITISLLIQRRKRIYREIDEI
ncbi:MAG: hypothetical protein ACP6IY_05885 [Promethearchaeia archaeon]